MSVNVTLRNSFSRESKPVVERHPRGKATLVDGRGQLLVLDSAEIDLTGERMQAETTLIPHVIATYADGEWASAKVSGK